MNKQKKKKSGQITHGLDATGIVWIIPLSGEKGLYAHRGSMSHDPWEKSANLWELPGKFILFCSALGALLLSIAQLWQPLPLLSEGRSKHAGIADAVARHPWHGLYRK